MGSPVMLERKNPCISDFVTFRRTAPHAIVFHTSIHQKNLDGIVLLVGHRLRTQIVIVGIRRDRKIGSGSVSKTSIRPIMAPLVRIFLVDAGVQIPLTPGIPSSMNQSPRLLLAFQCE